MRDERLGVIRSVVKEINKNVGETLLRFDIYTSSVKYQELVLFLSVCEPFVDEVSYKEHVYNVVRKSIKELQEDLDKLEKGC